MLQLTQNSILRSWKERTSNCNTSPVQQPNPPTDAKRAILRSCKLRFVGCGGSPSLQPSAASCVRNNHALLLRSARRPRRPACAARGSCACSRVRLRRSAVRLRRGRLCCRVACGALAARCCDLRRFLFRRLVVRLRLLRVCSRPLRASRPRLCVASLGVRARASGRPVVGRAGQRLLASVCALAPGPRPPCGSLVASRAGAFFPGGLAACCVWLLAVGVSWRDRTRSIYLIF